MKARIIFEMGLCAVIIVLMIVHFTSKPQYIHTKSHIVIIDTVESEPPAPIIKHIIQEKIIYVDSTSLMAEDISVNVDILGKPESIVIPISSQVFETSDYRAVISGYNISLDSIYLYRRTEYFKEVNTVVQKKRSRFGLGVQIGCGFNGEKIYPYAGVGVHYSLFSF